MIGAAREIARDIKLSHSVFALPFAALGAVYAVTRGGDPDWKAFAITAVLVLACMVSARTAAMVANRILDREFDARNPRTAGRAIPAGRLSLRAAVTGYLIACAVFVLCTALFGVLNGNWWPFALSIPVLAWICSYGFLKRFSALCHVWLGASLAMSPPAAALATNPSALATAAPWLMAGMVLCWVAGFDILYALQDVEVDRSEGLHSIPSKFGTAGALWSSRALHVIAVSFLVALYWATPALGAPFVVAIVIAAALLAVEHFIIWRMGSAAHAALFTLLNGVVSMVLGIAGIAGVAGAAEFS